MKQLLLFSILFIMITCYSQDIRSHQWENRVLLIFSGDKNDHQLLTQIQILSKVKIDLKERKLKVYQFVKHQFKIDFEEQWHITSLNTKKYNSKHEPFKVILIGLDGSVKLTKTSVLTTKKLFEIIDSMPMRKWEIRNKNE